MCNIQDASGIYQLFTVKLPLSACLKTQGITLSIGKNVLNFDAMPTLNIVKAGLEPTLDIVNPASAPDYNVYFMMNILITGSTNAKTKCHHIVCLILVNI